jgi:hypothetical protein
MDTELELPPEPQTRHITPAAEDYQSPITLMQVVWPTVWLVVAAALFFVVQHAGWPAFDVVGH